MMAIKYRHRKYALAFALSAWVSLAIAQEDQPESKPTDTSATPIIANIPTPERLSQQQKELLAALSTAPAPTWINVGNQKVLGFWQAELSGQPLGALLLLHDEDKLPLSPYIMNLHQHLPLEGWATLSIELPNPLPEPIPNRVQAAPLPKPAASPEQDAKKTENNAPEPEDMEKPDETKVVFKDDTVETTTTTTTTTEPMKQTQDPPTAPVIKLSAEDIQKQTMASIQAGMDYLQQQGQYNIVILGEGLGALRALQYTQVEPGSPAPKLEKKENNTTTTAIIERSIRALILLNINNTYAGAKNLTLELLTNKETPTLDIYTKPSSQNRQEAKARKSWARKNKLLTYRQKRLTPPRVSPSTDSETRLTKTIRGFLSRFAKGKEL